eukprot:gene9255-biopygen1568
MATAGRCCDTLLEPDWRQIRHPRDTHHTSLQGSGVVMGYGLVGTGTDRADWISSTPPPVSGHPTEFPSYTNRILTGTHGR